jgi:5'-nucleotidase
MRTALLCLLAGLFGLAIAQAQSPSSVAIRIIAFNDFHGHLEAGDNAVAVPEPTNPDRSLSLRSGGAAHLATRIAQLRAEQPASVVVSSGDLIGASPLVSGLFHDEPTIEAMNAIGVDANAVGNHEFDRGVQLLLRVVKGGCDTESTERRSCAGIARYAGANFPFLAANVIGRDDEKPILPPTLVREIGGVRIGFVGAVTRSTPGIVVPSGVAGVRFLAEAKALNHYARELQAQGVQAIVAIVHEGGDADGGFNDCGNPRGAIFDIVRELDPAIDIALSAHTHQGYNCVVDGRVVIQGASFGRLVSVVDLEVDRATGDVLRDRTRARNHPVPNGLNVDARLRAAYPPLAPDPRVAAIVEHYRERAAPLAQRPVGRIAGPFYRRPSAGGDHALGRLIADAHLAATRSNGAQIAFTNPGGIRTDLRASSPEGGVTYADAYAAQPFGNSLVTLTLSGEQLKLLLEQQWSATEPERVRILQPSAGFTYTWDRSRPRGSRIVADSMRLEGRAIDADRRYRVTVNSFLAAGGDGFRVLRDGTERTGGALDIDALTAHLQAESASRPLAPEAAARVRRRG